MRLWGQHGSGDIWAEKFLLLSLGLKPGIWGPHGLLKCCSIDPQMLQCRVSLILIAGVGKLNQASVHLSWCLIREGTI